MNQAETLFLKALRMVQATPYNELKCYNGVCAIQQRYTREMTLKIMNEDSVRRVDLTCEISKLDKRLRVMYAEYKGTTPSYPVPPPKDADCASYEYFDDCLMTERWIDSEYSENRWGYVH